LHTCSLAPCSFGTVAPPTALHLATSQLPRLVRVVVVSSCLAWLTLLVTAGYNPPVAVLTEMRPRWPILLLGLHHAAVTATAAASTGRPAFTVELQADGGTTVLLDGVVWLPSGATFVRHSNRTWSTHDGTLTLASAPTCTLGRDRGGAFNVTTLEWRAGSKTFETSVRVYSTHAVFRQTFTEKLQGTNCSSHHKEGVGSGWPTFRASRLPTPATRGVVSWQGIMAGMGTKVGPWPDAGGGTGVVGEGIEGSGPVAIFAEKMATTVVISSYRSFMAASQSVGDSPPDSSGDAVLSYGVMGSVTEIPAGFVIETVVSASQGGVNEAMLAWGDLLLNEYGKERYAYRRDYVLQHLGYSTDNGAFYCCCTPYSPPGRQCTNPPGGLNESYEDTLLAVKDYSAQTVPEIPYHYILLDSLWYYKGADGNVDVWDMRPTVFPNGLERFAARTGWKYQLHCGQKWTPETKYSTSQGGQYNFIIDGSPTAVPDDQRFWDDLLSNKTADGMTMYEMDWMNDQFGSSRSMLENITLGRTWLMQVESAARNVTTQYCMALCRQILQSVELLSVTNARASNDYHPGNSQWDIGTTSIFLHALGLAPSKDSYWSTTSVQTGSHWGDHVSEPNSELQSAVSSLSTGPVAASDKIGHSNSSLILRACDATGRLLTPDLPATELDAHFAHLAMSSARPSGASSTSRLESAVAKCALQNDTDYPGNDLGTALRNVTSASACCSACVATPDCQGFSWLNRAGFENYCSLKSAIGNHEHAAGHVSGSPGSAPSPPSPPPGPVVGVNGHLQATSVTLSGRWKTSYVLAASIAQRYNLSVVALGYKATDRLVAVQAHSPEQLKQLATGEGGTATTAAATLQIEACGLRDFQLWTVAPVLPNGWALLGEPGKWVRVSRQRFSGLEVATAAARQAGHSGVTTAAGVDAASANGTVTIHVQGGSGEPVTVDLMAPGGKLVRIQCELPQSGKATVVVEAAAGAPSCDPSIE
jgi:hypothetical protein